MSLLTLDFTQNDISKDSTQRKLLNSSDTVNERDPKNSEDYEDYCQRQSIKDDELKQIVFNGEVVTVRISKDKITENTQQNFWDS
jgi:cell division protein FtsI/penicillin-binding protein 2